MVVSRHGVDGQIARRPKGWLPVVAAAWCLSIEGGLEGLDVSGDHGRDALKSIRREGAAKSKAPIDADAGSAIAAVPEEALSPEVSLLDWAEAVG